MSDIVISKSQRTYPMPQSVIDEANRGLRWQKAYDVEPSEVASWLGGFLSTGGSVTSEMVGILASLAPAAASDVGNPADPDYPNPFRIEYALSGGEALQTWLHKVTASIEKTQDEALAASLERIGYYTSEDLYKYLGICDSEDDCIVRSLVRVASGAPDEWEVWNGADKTWDELSADSIRKFDAFELDREMVGFTAAAFSEKGVEGVRLVFAAPAAYLPFQPVTAAAPSDVQKIHFYAIVDATDTSAVMDLVSISPGPIVKVRNKGKWEDGSKSLALLTGINPPPLVELDAKTLQMVMAQIDGTYNAAETDPEYVESIGNEEAIKKKQEEDLKNQAAEFEQKRMASEKLRMASGNGPKDKAPASKPPSSGEKKPVTAALHALIDERDSTLELLQHAIDGAKIEEVNRRAAFEQDMTALRAGGSIDEDRLADSHGAELARREKSAAILEGLQREYSLADFRYRKRVAGEAVRAAGAARTRLAALETIAEATAVSASGSSSRSNSEVLRRYVTKGEGALKLRWGVDGDPSRCVRYVSKYIGSRAQNYCSGMTATALQWDEPLDGDGDGYYDDIGAKLPVGKARLDLVPDTSILPKFQPQGGSSKVAVESYANKFNEAIANAPVPNVAGPKIDVPGATGEKLSGGAMALDVWRANFDGEEFVVKNVGQSPTEARYEAAASDIGRALGFNIAARPVDMPVHDGEEIPRFKNNYAVMNKVGEYDGGHYVRNWVAKLSADHGELDDQGRQRTFSYMAQVPGSFRMAVMDLILANIDRHGGNWRASGDPMSGDAPVVYPIDHGGIDMDYEYKPDKLVSMMYSDFVTWWFPWQKNAYALPTREELLEASRELPEIRQAIEELQSDFISEDEHKVVLDRLKVVEDRMAKVLKTGLPEFLANGGSDLDD